MLLSMLFFFLFFSLSSALLLLCLCLVSYDDVIVAVMLHCDVWRVLHVKLQLLRTALRIEALRKGGILGGMHHSFLNVVVRL